MTNALENTSSPELPRTLKTLMVLRVLLISTLLGALIFMEARGTLPHFGKTSPAHYLFLAAVYLISIIYALLLKYLKNFSFQAYIQTLTDTLLITILICFTGGIESIFSFLYILTIFSASILLYRRGGIIAASASSILYGLLLDLHYYGVIHPLGTRWVSPETYQSSYLFFTILANMAGFYLVAYLSSFLSEQARKSRAELRAKELDLNRLEGLNESIIGSITSSLIVLNDHNRIILFNPAAEKMFGIGSTEAFGRPIGEVLPLFARGSPGRQVLSTHGKNREPSFPDLPYTRPDGTEVYLRVLVSPLIHSFGNRKGQILTLQDVTQIKRFEKEMRKVEGLALIGELAAGMAHEIRNPMASISGSIEIIRDRLEKDDVNVRLMNIVLRETDRLNELVSDFLLFAGPKEAKLIEIDLNLLIRESLELFQNSPRWNRGIEIFTDFPYSVRIRSDPDQLRQVLWNLFLNASDAMTQGGELHIATELIPDPHESGVQQAKIVIRDTGEGFTENCLDHLFLPFFTTKEGGSGLGLAIVKRIVDRLGGQVSAANHPKGGAEITILLPVGPEPLTSRV